jgi:putative transposase
LRLRAIQEKKFKVTTDSNHSKPIALDLLEQNCSATVPNQKWTTDISYVWSDEGWLYLAVVMDLYSRAIVGWSMNRRMAQTSIFEYIETYYNRQRKHSAIGYRIPMLFDNAA